MRESADVVTSLRRSMIVTVIAAGALGGFASRAAASGCDLYTAAATCTFNGANFYSVDPQPTGTGFIDSFLRVQQNGTEQGYNTGARPLQSGINDKTDPNFTRNLEVAAVPVVNGYRQFFLDINEQAADWGKLLTLDQLKIFVSDSPDLNNYSAGSGGSLTGATKVYDMDTLVKDNWINLDYTLNKGGSGKGDMVVYIPDVGFAGHQYVYLYSEFGCVPDKNGKCGTGQNTKYASGAGFEEWWVLSPNQNVPVPEPGTLALVCAGAAAFVRRRRS